MSSKAMSLKGKIKNYAKSNSIAAQVVLQNYMFERFLERLSMINRRNLELRKWLFFYAERRWIMAATNRETCLNL